MTANARDSWGDRLRRAMAAGGGRRPQAELADRADLDQLLPPGAAHQGIALLADPLPGVALEEACELCAAEDAASIVVLDQATDPHNVGAVVRSAAAFGARAVVVPDRHAPEVTGALAKAASGAIETVPLVRVVNLARALEVLKKAGFWCVGLAAGAATTLAEAKLSGKIALVLGSEGEGLRRLTRESCDFLARIPIAPHAGSLNLSNAAAIALYELNRSASRPA
jgi:23S rRNA (guanosine2251-2'-O)-methyltransferase